MKLKLNFFSKIKKFFIHLFGLDKFYVCDKKAFAKLNASYFDEFNFLADNAEVMRKRTRRKIDKLIFKRYMRDYKTLSKQEKLNRIEL